MTDLKNESERYTTLINDIETGQLKIPQFQRKFVWDLKQSAKLIDSIIKGYPIGTFIFWRTNERLRSIRNVGNLLLPEPKQGEHVNYVLDGQQRITSIYAMLKGVQVLRDDGRYDDYSSVYVDLDATEDAQIILTDVSGKVAGTYIKIVDLLQGTRKQLKQYDEKYDEWIDSYKLRLTSYEFSVVSLKNASIDVATDVFTRLNVGGRALTLFEIMVAKTYDESKQFDLAAKFEELIEELASSKYDTISDATVLQVVSVLLKGDCTRRTILQLEKASFIGIWNDATDAIKSTVDFFIDQFSVKVSKLLPYNALVVPFSYFFYKHKAKPTGELLMHLADYFWRSSLGNRFSSSVESKIAQDVRRIDDFLREKWRPYEWAIEIEPDDIINQGWFGTGRSFIKALLTIMVSKSPKSFDDNRMVRIDNSWLKIASSKNYHHFFPKAFMARTQKQYEEWQYNNIVNITIVDDYLNKNVIRAKAPSKYIAEFMEINPQLKTTLETHFIGSISELGILENDYQKFMQGRAKALSDAIKDRIILGNEKQDDLIHYEDFDEQEEEE